MKYKSKTTQTPHRNLPDVTVHAEIAAVHQMESGFVVDGRYHAGEDVLNENNEVAGYSEKWTEPFRRSFSDEEAQALATALNLSDTFIAEWRSFVSAATIYALGQDSGFGQFE